MNIFFADKDPVENIALEVKAKRVKCIRLDTSSEKLAYYVGAACSY